MLTPNPNYSDAEADALGLVHEGMITMARNQIIFLDAIPGSGRRRLELEDLVNTSIAALVDLGRPRVAPDLRANGWRLGEQGEWMRPYTTDEYPFDAELDANCYSGFVYARNNDHARMIDGTIAVPKWGIIYGTADDYVT